MKKKLIVLLIVTSCGFVTNAENVTTKPGIVLNATSNSVNFNSGIALMYDKFINSIAFGNVVNQFFTDLFSKFFSDIYWCYDPYPCFRVGGPYISAYRPTSLAPFPPDKANITFELYTRKNPKIPFVFKNPNNLTQIKNSNFKNTSKVIFIVAGFISGNGSALLNLMLQPLLNYDDYNIVNVNWGNSSNTSYEQAVANVRMVGAMIYKFTDNIKSMTGIPLSDFYCIGHSLGAHACGSGGRYFSGEFGRITGLDPAGPYFENTDPDVRLDPRDAKLVDVIHTNAGTVILGEFGIMQQVGHLDFYPNGGSEQPGCQLQVNSSNFKTLNDALRSYSVACSHGRAVEYFAESIPTSSVNQCEFTSYLCDSYDSFLANKCPDCEEDDTYCAEMGFNAYKYAELHPIPVEDGFYLQTNSKSPYCNNFTPSSTESIPTTNFGSWLSGG